MIDVTVGIRINRPVEAVFGYVADIANDPMWNTDVLEARQTTEGPVGKGARFHLRNKPSMGISEGTAEVIDFELNRRQVFQADYGRMKPVVTHLFEFADDATTLTRRVQFDLPGMMWLMQPFVRRMARKRNAAFLANLKNLLES